MTATTKSSFEAIAAVDPEILPAMHAEVKRQQETIELIASENHVSKAVLEALGSVFTNKYAEGYPGKRYYGGCQNMDTVEDLARERAKKLFGCDAVNVQPHSGASANAAVYLAVLEPGDTILSLSLAHGGHLSHGLKVNMGGLLYKIVPYQVDPKTEQFDYEEIRRLAREHKPRLIISGASAYPRTIDFAEFSRIAEEVGAVHMADIAHIAGLVATGLHPSPIPSTPIVTTTTHKTLRGPRGGMIMCHEDWGKKINSRVFPGSQGGPLMHCIAAKAVAFAEALKPDFKTYQQQILKNARTLAEGLAQKGNRLVSGGTDTHLMLVDLRPKGLTGRDAEASLERACMTCNKNGIPFDPEKPMVTSGVRLGTPAATTRGFRTDEFKQVGNLISDVLDGLAANPEDNGAAEAAAREQVEALCGKFPIYGNS